MITNLENLKIFEEECLKINITNLDHFKNIVYVGGKLHFKIIYLFIFFLKQKTYFNQINEIMPKFPENEKIRCIEFEEPIEIF